MYDTIVVPVDGSPEARTAAEQARDLAADLGSSVHLFYVIPATGYLFGVDAVVDVDKASSRVAELATDVFGDSSVDVQTTVRRGDQETLTLAFLEEVDADLVVLGRKETPEVRDYLFWSTPAQIVRESEISVLLAHPDTDGGDR
ncbi:universal stress protein [Natronobacterium gregoryi]|uniref:Universal stress protein n=2 Tax=Natronobacterium gregoryi TaxID=44930 RepID=L0AHP9_NATGS|nr:universal stress protein [Natronobacterium gregoryi]AFZ73331.1 universal stress protein UspA-like protein [Natronobacterium gregoryi SP2]ELY73894.1 UspA domain-containing protein [Natronobacterium gregoryi SP2]PLK19880.1 universal stress protein [Natronobacterium gregoryi SP2]SFJ37240.1 Nucleotide-binding universal stress protein, UspA family [Natronobacterium gregoryi]